MCSLRQPLQALLYAAAAAALSCHKNSKAYYRAAMAVDSILGSVLASDSSSGSGSTDAVGISNGISSVSDSGSGSSSSSGSGKAYLQALKASQLAAAAKALMQTSIQLSGPSTAAAKSQMLAALKNVTAAGSKASPAEGTKAGRKKGNSSSSTTGEAAGPDDGGWGVVLGLLAVGATELKGCFTESASRVSDSSSGNAAAADSSTSSGKDTGSSTAVDASHGKEAGNAAFTRGDYTQALHHCQAAFACLCRLDGLGGKPAARLLSNRAVCGLQLSSRSTHQQAFVDGLSSALLDATSVRAFHRAVTALMQLDRLSNAQSVLQLAISLVGKAPALKDLQKRLNTVDAAAQVATGAEHSQTTDNSSKNTKGKKDSAAKDSSPGSATSSSSSSGGGGGSSPVKCRSMNERQYKKLQEADNMRVEQLADENDELTLAAHQRGMDAAGLSELVDNRLPPFHEELSKAGRWPALVDTSWASLHLWEAYEAACALPRHFQMVTDFTTLTPQILMHRLISSHPERMKWLATTRRWGDVSFLPDFQLRLGYKGSWQSWAKCPRPEILSLGTTHVAVGFVDLGELASSCELQNEIGPSIVAAAAAGEEGGGAAGAGGDAAPAAAAARGASSRSSGGAAAAAGDGLGGSAGEGGGAAAKPLRWVGYEMSAYCVAKTLIILQMIEQEAAEDEVLQVWYSAAWSKATLKAFRKATTSLLTAAAKRKPHPSAAALCHPDVLELLQHWQVKDVKLAAARRSWQDTSATPPWAVANFKGQQDRMALCQLALTGELPALGPADGGNVTMFAVPKKLGDRAFDECFLRTLFIRRLAGVWRSQPSADIVSVGVQMLRQRTQHLVQLLRAGLVQVEVRYGHVRLEETSNVTAIKALQPYTVSWSNMADYMPPADFHRLARTISSPDTLHFMHSVNWIATVKGASYVDYMLSLEQEDLKAIMSKFLDIGQSGVKKWYQAMGLDAALLWPAADSPRNVIDFACSNARFKDWVAAFFAPGLSGMQDLEKQVHVVEPPVFNVLASIHSTIHLTFSYDSDIDLAGLSDD